MAPIGPPCLPCPPWSVVEVRQLTRRTWANGTPVDTPVDQRRDRRNEKASVRSPIP